MLHQPAFEAFKSLKAKRRDGYTNVARANAASASAAATTEAEGSDGAEIALTDFNDGWATEASFSQTAGLATWRIRDDYALDGSLAHRAFAEDFHFESFSDEPEVDVNCGNAPCMLRSGTSSGGGLQYGQPSAAAGASLARQQSLRSTLVSLSGSSSDEEGDGLFTLVNKRGTPESREQGERRITNRDL